MKKGFTLIEAIIYIALLSLLLGGAVLCAYQILQGSTSLTGNTIIQDEGGFVLRKLEWALSGASTASASGSTLTVTRFDGTTVNFRLSGGAVEMLENAGAFARITTTNVQVTSLVFATTGTNPLKVTATMMIKGTNSSAAPLAFSFTKFLRI